MDITKLSDFDKLPAFKELYSKEIDVHSKTSMPAIDWKIIFEEARSSPVRLLALIESDPSPTGLGKEGRKPTILGIRMSLEAAKTLHEELHGFAKTMGWLLPKEAAPQI
jgi:hypothetical protein